MRFAAKLAHVVPLFGAFLLGQAREASAGGGMFPEDASAQVASHRVILSLSESATTLWDQIQYTGDPKSFAWVLPVKGTATVGVSSDALFQVLDYTLRARITPLSYCGEVIDLWNSITYP